jgi:hypothetical protein
MIGAVLVLVLATVAISISSASAAPLFTDDFEDGNATGWTTSGGGWSGVTDGSRALRQPRQQRGVRRQPVTLPRIGAGRSP